MSTLNGRARRNSRAVPAATATWLPGDDFAAATPTTAPAAAPQAAPSPPPIMPPRPGPGRRRHPAPAHFDVGQLQGQRRLPAGSSPRFRLDNAAVDLGAARGND